LGTTASASSTRLVEVALLRLAALDRNDLISPTSAFSFSASAMSLLRMALPISLEAALRRSWACCSFADMGAARLVPRDEVVDGRLCGFGPTVARLTSASTSAFGFSRIHLMSSMVAQFRFTYGAGESRFARAGSREIRPRHSDSRFAEGQLANVVNGRPVGAAAARTLRSASLPPKPPRRPPSRRPASFRSSAPVQIEIS
jgi:hypothetical protein